MRLKHGHESTHIVTATIHLGVGGRPESSFRQLDAPFQDALACPTTRGPALWPRRQNHGSAFIISRIFRISSAVSVPSAHAT